MTVAIFVIVGLAIAAGIITAIYFARRGQKPSGPPSGDVLAATNLIWHSVFGMTDNPPMVTWVTGKQLDCRNGTGWWSNGQCVAGVSWTDTGRSAVAWVPGELLSDTALAHELGHHWLYRKGLPADPNHTGPAFAVDGIVDQANAELRVRGL